MMATSKALIQVWLEDARKQGAKFVIIATDTFDWEDYPVPVMDPKKVKSEIARLSDPNKMSMVMEIYDLSMPIAAQLDEHRARHLP